MKHTFRAISVAALAASALVLTGCAGGGEEASSGPVTLDYWTWAPAMDVVANDHYLDHRLGDPAAELSFAADLTRAMLAKFVVELAAVSGGQDLRARNEWRDQAASRSLHASLSRCQA